MNPGILETAFQNIRRAFMGKGLMTEHVHRTSRLQISDRALMHKALRLTTSNILREF
jgi:hypothetical protein